MLENDARHLLRRLGDCDTLALRVEVHWNSRLRSTAGRAWQGRGRVELNPRLQLCGEEEISRTLRHELAHLVAHQRAARPAGRRRIDPHGREWRRACADLGIPGEARTHRLEALQSRRLARRHVYVCPVCGLEYPRARPLRRPLACGACCNRHARGRFDARFRLRPR